MSALNEAGKQDTVAGVSADGKTVLWQRRTCTNGVPFQLLISDSNGIAFSIADLTAQVALAPMAVDEEGTVSLTADGLTIIGMSDDRTMFLRSSREAIGSSVFGPVSNTDFAAFNVDTLSRIHFPVISSDGLAFYFHKIDGTNPSRNGLYESVRTSTTVPFPAATRMPALVQSFNVITGISADRLTLFVENHSFQTVVLTRKSIRDSFVNPNSPGTIVVQAFRTRPFGDCQTLIGTYTPSGCEGQDLAIFTPQ